MRQQPASRIPYDPAMASMTSSLAALPLIDDELDLLGELVPLAGQEIIELGCGNAQLACALLERHPDSSVTALEVDERQHAKNLASSPRAGLRFVVAGAQAVPFPDASFDLALMLKSLHHVPLALMSQALREIARVLRPGGHLYVSEPVFAGVYNDVIRLFNDEQAVRGAAQAALDKAVHSGAWQIVADRWFETTMRFRDFEDFEQRVIGATYAERRLSETELGAVRAAFERHLRPDGARFTRPMHVRLLRSIPVPRQS
jgi:ubiquinone/menaquinone biosynthesis C-methylase UbiE